MIKIGIWIAIIILLILLRGRIANAVLGVAFLFCITIFSVYMLDEFTTFELRKFGKKPMEGYDTFIEDPSGVVGDFAGNVKEYGEDVTTKINKRGDELDGKYGTDINKDEKGSKEKEKEINEKEEKVEKDKKDKGEESKRLGEVLEVKYVDVQKVLQGELKGIGERDKDLIESLVPMLELHYVGDDYEVWNDKESVYIVEIK